MISIRALHRRTLWQDLAELWAYRDVFFVLSMREIQIRYKQAAIGIAWVVVQPVLTSAIFTLVFSWLARIPSDDVPYPVFVFSGLLIWQYISRTITEGTTSLVAKANIITKVFFPRLLIPMTVPVVAGVDFLLGFAVLLVMMLLFGVPITWSVLFVPVVLVMAGVFAYGVILWLAPFNALYRDVGIALPFMVQIVMYLSPVIYPVSFVPERYQWVFDFNPVATVINTTRWALVGGPLPSSTAFAFFVVFTLVLVLAGLRVFRAAESSFVDRV